MKHKVYIYCKCGASWRGVISSKAGARVIVESFRKIHIGPGCAPCGAKTGRMTRWAGC